MNMSMIELRDILVRFFVFVFLLIFLSMVLEGCTDKCETTHVYYYYEPVYTSLEEIRTRVKQEPPREMAAYGKIYIYGNTLFVNEPGEGVHVIDNSDKSNPNPLSFIRIPGNFDIAAKGNYLYADNYLDVLTFDLSDISNIKLVKRIENVYKNFGLGGIAFQVEQSIVTDWNLIETVDHLDGDCGEFNGNVQTWREGVLLSSDFAGAGTTALTTMQMNSASITPQPGIGGSMARFAIASNHLYAIDESQMYVFSLSNLADPTFDNTVDVGWGIETIFPYKQNLFIGANNGMHIFDNTNPGSPQYLSSFMHFTACDPVVVNDDYAFVTLRSGNNCNGFVNQMDVVDIRDLSNPQLVKTYLMDNPHGLGIDGDNLFLCEGEFGLKVFNTNDIQNVNDNLIKHIENIHAYDVIPFQNNLIMIGQDGLYQFDYADPEALPLLSHIPVSTPQE